MPPSRSRGRYEARGVSPAKEDVHKAVAGHANLFSAAFCRVVPDFVAGGEDWCNIIHADGCGTKSLVAYLWYRERGDAAVFEGLAQDSLAMNVDDLACAGAVSGILAANTINRNPRRCGAEVLERLIHGAELFAAKLRDLDCEVFIGGGETADTPDLTPTFTLDSCAVARLRRSEVIRDGITSGLAIVGLSSTGRASFEDAENSGMGSNGLTSARHDLLSSFYAKKYPETFDAGVDPSLVYAGPYRLEDPLPGSSLSVGAALLSPTRSYAPVIARLLKDPALRRAIRALVHCTGGGQTKCLRFAKSCHIIKDRTFALPPLFRAIRAASGSTLEELARVFNLGWRLEVYCEPAAVSAVLAVASSFGIEAREIGRTEAARGGTNRLSLRLEGEDIEIAGH